ncbi:hypothetical protein PHYPSEUDO_014344 [Phytophthora pseudosyringae]|uniref:Uncharacterized protein n=1 Tax=Phytophthora pseudosyringae TaxID=221518 RepID=A0A8T1WGA3_9STRA|nr:hypothetical protein PHYPSEUDO_014344 [Phytophthora pseudosyringae]
MAEEALREEEDRSAEAARRARAAKARTRSKKSRAIERVREKRAGSDNDPQAGGNIGPQQGSGAADMAKAVKDANGDTSGGDDAIGRPAGGSEEEKDADLSEDGGVSRGGFEE